ncbi:hypothetical protein FPZ41_37530 [Streptomyces sp. K1PN6]|uniref:Uncharacterized protein n=1 Tax=Streptomyces acidicola TaxID=2596892 RepID=A0A5N8X316_9ACTN|nr:hypothetical protein [Streptomyces acidicola]
MRTKPTMGKRMLRSVLVAAFSAVVAFGSLSGFSGAEGKGDSVWSSTANSTEAGDGETPAGTDDSVWS